MSGNEIFYGLESLLGEEHHKNTLLHKTKRNSDTLNPASCLLRIIERMEDTGWKQYIVTHYTPLQIEEKTGSKKLASLPQIDIYSRAPDIPFGINYDNDSKNRIIIGCRATDLYPTNKKGKSIMITDRHPYIESISTVQEILLKLTSKNNDEEVDILKRFDQIYSESAEFPGLEETQICNTPIVHPKKPVYVEPVRLFNLTDYNSLIGYAALGKNGKKPSNPLRIIKINQPIES